MELSKLPEHLIRRGIDIASMAAAIGLNAVLMASYDIKEQIDGGQQANIVYFRGLELETKEEELAA